MEDRLKNVEQRLDDVEASVVKLRTTVHDINGKQQGMIGQMTAIQSSVTAIKINTDKITTFIAGANKVAGVATRHWKTALKFGCGVITAWGFTNPHVGQTATFVAKFFGL